MEERERTKILKQLSRTPGDKAQSALERAAEKCNRVLLSSRDLQQLLGALEELGIFAFRVSSICSEILGEFISRAEREWAEFDASEFPFSNRSDVRSVLISESLTILERVRYFQMPTVLKWLLTFSVDQSEELRKQAIEGLSKCAVYDINVFFSGEGRAGLGASPQLQLLSEIENGRDRWMEKYPQALATVCNQLLSPTMESTSLHYDTVSWETASVPVTSDIEKVRNDAMQLLFQAFNKTQSTPTKLTYLNALMTATETPRGVQLNEALSSLIERNTLSLFDWLRAQLPALDFAILQKIEHQVYWRFFHGISQEVRDAALLIRDDLAKNTEYQIYRDLIGFESIFEDWETSLKKERDFEEIERIRSSRALQYAAEINATNWQTWRDRILKFCETESNDLATFPKFFEFLREFAILQPDLALELISDHLSGVASFTIPIYRGIWKTDRQEELRRYFKQPDFPDVQLAAAARVFLAEPVDDALLVFLLDEAISRGNEQALCQLIEVSISSFGTDQSNLIDRIFVPAVRTLNSTSSTNWLHNIWYRPNLKALLKELDDEQTELVLQSFVQIERVSYEQEDILAIIAERRVQRVIDLFGLRLQRKQSDESSDYEAVPFTFHTLQTTFSNHPNAVIETARRWYKIDNRLFSFRGGRFVANALPIVKGQVEEAFFEVVRSNSREDLKFLLAVFRNYHGEEFLHPLCRELADKLVDDELANELEIVLMETGVVTGEFGFSNEYMKRIEQLQPWLEDERSSVRKFATSFIKKLERYENFYREQAEEEITLRKHEYGLDQTDIEDGG